MTREELLLEIDVAFEESSKLDSWEYKNFKNLLERKQLSHFQIFEISWFPGAAKIMDLVDKLHSIETPKQDFLNMAKILGIEIDESLPKSEIAKIVKSNKNWKVSSSRLNLCKKVDMRRQRLQPLFNELKRYGYETDMLPQQVVHDKWIVDATNEEGEKETLYLNESPDKNYVLVQSFKNDVICVLGLEESGLIQKIRCDR